MKKWLRNTLLATGLLLVPVLVLSQTTTVSPVRTITCSAGQFINQLANTGIFTCAVPAGASGITALTGDVTATGPGSVPGTLANTAVTPGSYTNTGLTVNSKGLITAASSGTPGGGLVILPQGRLSLTSGVPVMSADATAQSTIYLSCYKGNTEPVAGANLTIGACEISMGLAAANVISGSVYDVFAVNNAGTLVICTPVAWTSTTARGTGAGTTEIHRDTNGLWTNANSLTNCYGGGAGTTNYGSISVDAGTYRGSFYATANGQTGIQFFPAAANGGTNTIVGLYNAYNQVPITSFSFDNTSSYTYGSTTWRVANAGGTGSGLNNRITWLDGLGQSTVVASFNQVITANASVATKGQNGIVFDATTGTPTGLIGEGATNSTSLGYQGVGINKTTLLGLHYAQAMEAAFTATTKYFGLITYITVQLDMMN